MDRDLLLSLVLHLCNKMESSGIVIPDYVKPFWNKYKDHAFPQEEKEQSKTDTVEEVGNKDENKNK